MGEPESQRRLPFISEGLPSRLQRKEGLPMYITYADLIQIGIFICTLVGLIYQIGKGKK